MKKYLSATIIAIAAICNAYAIDISNCEKFGSTGPMGDWIVKCAPTDELRTIQSNDANCMFQSVGDTDTIIAMASDTAHVYVNVTPDECGPNTTGYRVFTTRTKKVDGAEFYAIDICE